MPPATADNHGPLLNVAMWIVLVPMCISAGVKVLTKWGIIRKLQMDDYFMIFAMFAAMGQCIATSKQVQYGLGKNQPALSHDQIEDVFISRYVSQIMYLVAVYVAKLAGLYFFLCLTGDDMQRSVVLGAMAFVVAWLFINILVVAFQCQLPKPWVDGAGRCIDQRAFWTVNGVVDGVTQIIVGLLPIYLLSGLQMTHTRKRLTMLSFSPNLLTLPLIILRLVYLYSVFTSTNYTWDAFKLALITNLHASISVIAASVPFSKAFIDSLVIAPAVITDDGRGFLNRERPSKPMSLTDSTSNSSNPNPDPYLQNPPGTYNNQSQTSREQKRSSRSSRTGMKTFLDNPVRWPRSEESKNTTTVTSLSALEGWQELQECAPGSGFRSEERIGIRQTKSTTVTSTPGTHDSA